MTAANLLARLRTLLDESSEAFWTDTECYAALADAQNAVITIGLAIYRAKKVAMPNQDIPLSNLLQSLYAVQTGTVASGQSTATLTGTVLELVYLKYNHSAASPQYPCRIRNFSPASEFKAANSFLVATPASGEYYARRNNLTITFETASTNSAAAYSAGVLTQPTDIASGQNPTIPDSGVPAMLQFALSRMLSKDEQTEESELAFKRFGALAQAAAQ